MAPSGAVSNEIKLFCPNEIKLFCPNTFFYWKYEALLYECT